MVFEGVVDVALQKIPEKFRAKLRNVAFLIEDEPADDVRIRENLDENETLLGYYRGIPLTERGSMYGVGETVPDTITIYRIPNEDEAYESGKPLDQVVYETVWHEIAHYLGMNEDEVRHKELKRERRHSDS